MKKVTNKPQIAIYQALGNEQKIRVRIEDENVWLSQKLISELFNVDVRTVNEHLVNIYLERELEENSTIRNFRITAADDKSYDAKHYNLDAILAVGYRDGHYFGKMSVPAKQKIEKGISSSRKPTEYWECPKCYWN